MGGTIRKAKQTVERVIDRGKGFLFGRPSESHPEVEAGLLDPTRINEVISRLMNLTGQGPQTFGEIPTGIEQSPFFGHFRSAVTDRFVPTAPENQLLEDIMGRTSAQFARRGLGVSPVSATGTAASIAPSLIQLRQNRINELGNAISQWQVGQGMGLTQRGQNIGAALDQRTTALNSLLNLLQFGRSQPLGQTSRGETPGLFDVAEQVSRTVANVKGGGKKGDF